MARYDEAGTVGPRSDHTVVNLLGELAHETSRLFRQEIALARSEMLGKFGQFGKGTIEMTAGGLIAYAGFLTLLAAAVLGLSNVVAPWLAAVIVGVAAILVGGGIIIIGRRSMAPTLLPDRTLRTLRENALWARKQIR